MKKTIAKSISFLAIFAWLMGSIGGIGYAIYGGSWPVALSVGILSLMSLQTVKEAYHYLTEED